MIGTDNILHSLRKKGDNIMTFQGFSTEDFDTFYINGLEERMTAIQERIQPKFKELGTDLSEELSFMLGKEMHLHIAKHARRTKNPPKDTWLAVADNKRGYKKHPHFQVGLFDDHVFVWLAFIYEMPEKEKAATSLLEMTQEMMQLDENFRISPDHTKKESFLLKEIDDEKLTSVLHRFRDVKKGEFLLGKHFDREDPIVQNGDALLEEIKNTFETLAPYYHASLRVL